MYNINSYTYPVGEKGQVEGFEDEVSYLRSLFGDYGTHQYYHDEESTRLYVGYAMGKNTMTTDEFKTAVSDLRKKYDMDYWETVPSYKEQIEELED